LAKTAGAYGEMKTVAAGRYWLTPRAFVSSYTITIVGLRRPSQGRNYAPPANPLHPIYWAAGDAGGAVGAALAAVHLYERQPGRTNGGDGMAGALLGPSFRQADIERRLRAVGGRFHVGREDAVVEVTANAHCAAAGGRLVPGRMEFGPRALGARSILGDPRSPAMQRNLNLQIKFRESFRPLAPAVL